ncbi:hypothetical protein HZS_4903 [Henneguya salminicola]|nr:hypothetical protein HZS_4903 [Henneguya salminicola]
MYSISDEIVENLTPQEIEELAKFADEALKPMKNITLYELSLTENATLKQKGRKIDLLRIIPEPNTVVEKPAPVKEKPMRVDVNIEKNIENFNKYDSDIANLLENVSKEELGDLLSLRWFINFLETLEENPRQNQENGYISGTKNQAINGQKFEAVSISIEELIQNYTINQEKYLNLSYNHITFGIADQLFKFIILPECKIETLIMANCGLNELYMTVFIYELAESLDKNKSIKHLNIETNNINGKGLIKLFSELSKSNSTITELKIMNQSSMIGELAEENLEKMVEKNENIIKLSYDSNHRKYKDRIERLLMRNRDKDFSAMKFKKSTRCSFYYAAPVL